MFGFTSSPHFKLFCQAYCRSFSKFNTLEISNKGTKEARIFNKLLGGGKKKRSYYPASEGGGSTNFFDYYPDQNKSVRTDRRLAVLNKLYMKNITDVLSTGELSSEVVGRGIQISSVKVTKLIDQVNVYWVGKGTEEDDKTDELLTMIAPKLRYEMSRIHVMGYVPKILFIKDMLHSKVKKLEQLLETADFGDDYELTPVGCDWKTEPELEVKLSPEIKEEIKKVEERADLPNEPMPSMRMDTFGLNHAAIMNRIKERIEKSKAPHRMNPKVYLSPESLKVINSNNPISEKERKVLFREFLNHQRIVSNKARKNKNNFRPEVEMHEKDMESELMNEFMASTDENNWQDEYYEDDYGDYDSIYKSDYNKN